jgi:HK97 family phage prohead protease
MADSKPYADPKNGKYPIDTKAHAKAAWSYISMPKNAAQYPLNGVTLASVKARIKAACAKFGVDISEGNSGDPDGEERRPADGDMLIRSVPFEVTRAADSRADGLTLEGYAAVFNRKALIQDYQGEFEEQIAPGAFAESLARKIPVLMFEHGKHPLIGSMPLGRIEDAHEDKRGLFISARLSDNWLIQPVRDAVRDGAVDGMSFRFTPPGDDDQQWAQRSGKPDLRTLLRLNCPELGPVVFPAYEPTTAAVRSLLDGLDLDEDFTGRDGARSAPGGEEDDVQPGNGGPSPTTSRAALRDRAWRMRRQLHA